MADYSDIRNPKPRNSSDISVIMEHCVQVSDLSEESGTVPDNSEDDPDGTVGGTVSAASDAMRVRLRTAVSRAGGATAVASRAHVSERTLTRLMSGGTVRRTTFLAIASGAGVAPEWLEAGEGAAPSEFAEPKAPFEAPSGADSGAPQAPSEHLRRAMGAIASDARGLSARAKTTSIWDLVDFDALVLCLELQEDLDRLGGGQIKSARSRLKRAFNAYDIEKNDEEA